MLRINCPHCGPRDETEFACGGVAHIKRPEHPGRVGDERWAEYLFYRDSPKGVHLERWRHSVGCGRWFNAARDTVTDRFLKVYAMGDPPPDLQALRAELPEAGAGLPRRAYAENRPASDRVSGVIEGGDKP